jgi:hypothetical protein
MSVSEALIASSVQLRTTIFVLLALFAGVAVAQEDMSDPPPSCKASSAFIDPSNPAYSGVAWNFDVSCSTTDNRVSVDTLTVTFDVFRADGSFQQRFTEVRHEETFVQSSHFAGMFLPALGCLAPGDYQWRVGYGCFYSAPTER